MGLLFLLESISGKPQCPLGTPCSCVWDKNNRTSGKNKRNVLSCSDKGITENSLPTLSGTGNNLTFFKVNLSMNHFDHIPVQFVDFLTGVEFVDFTSNTLTGLPDRLISIPNLRRLYLSENEIATIGTGKYVNVSNLWTFLLDNNSLVSLEAGVFAGLKVLNHLTLSSNQLETFSKNTFKNLGQLDYLSTTIISPKSRQERSMVWVRYTR